MLTTLPRALISIAAMLAVLIFIGFLWIIYLGLGEDICFDLTRGGDRRRTPPRLAQVTSTSRDITPRSRSVSTPARSRIMDDLWPGLAGLIVLGVVIAVFALGYFVWVFCQLVVLGAT
jgi:hypothetical protein